jgi:hypothetical protein
MGNRKSALDDYEHALTLMPDDSWLPVRIAELRGGKAQQPVVRD